MPVYTLTPARRSVVISSRSNVRPEWMAASGRVASTSSSCCVVTMPFGAPPDELARVAPGLVVGVDHHRHQLELRVPRAPAHDLAPHATRVQLGQPDHRRPPRRPPIDAWSSDFDTLRFRFNACRRRCGGTMPTTRRTRGGSTGRWRWSPGGPGASAAAWSRCWRPRAPRSPSPAGPRTSAARSRPAVTAPAGRRCT